MPVEDDFNVMQTRFGEFQQHLDRLQQRLPPGEESRGQLESLRRMLQSRYDEFVATFKAENQRLDSEMAELRARMKASEAEIAELKAARQQQRAAAQAVPVPKPDVPVDPELGKKLREIILKELAEPERRHAAARSAAGEVAEMGTRDFATEPSPASPSHPAPEKPRQPRKPKVGEESFEWESSDEWEKKGL